MGNPLLAEADQARKTGDINKARQLYQQVANTAADQSQKTYALNQLYGLPQQGTTPVIQSASQQKPAPVSAFSSPNPAGVMNSKPPEWSAYGRIRDTGIKREDGQPIFVLEDAPGHALAYVTTNPDKSLQQYIGRTIAVYGPKVYNTTIRLEYVLASHVAVP
jgi:hypothetical protein